MSKKSKLDCSVKLNDAGDDVLTKIHLGPFMDILTGVCKTRYELLAFCRLMDGVKPGNIIYRDHVAQVKKKYPRSCGYIFEGLEKTKFAKMTGDGDIIINPLLMMYGVSKSERKDLSKTYNNL